MTDFAEQRTNMVESQVRPSDVTDRRIVRAMQQVPREAFVARDAMAIAYMDEAVRIGAAGSPGAARALMAPRVFAKLLQLAALEATDVVLDVGCGTGYGAAVMGAIVKTVVALEADPGLAAEAVRIGGPASQAKIMVVTGPLAGGYPSEGPYDTIVLEGAIASAPTALLEQLKDGGRLVAVEQTGAMGKAVLWRRLGEGFDRQEAFDASAPPLPGFEAAATFAF